MSLALAFLAAAAALPQEGEDLAGVLRQVRERAARSVVALEIDRESDPDGIRARGSLATHTDYYNRPKGPASGVIYEADGHIVTTYFNVSGVIRKNGLKVILWDGREVEGRVLGWDEGRDIALLKIEEKDLPVLPRADFKTLAQGSFLALIGRSPDKANPTVNFGILSALSRMKNAAVQTDAETNYGNAGGALVTLRAELVGVACNVKPDAVWGQSGGVGFACKTAEIDALLPRLKAGERIPAEKQPFLGIQPGEGNPDVGGLQVAQVAPGSPAEKAGLKPEDVIVEFDGQKVPDFETFSDLLQARKAGDEVAIKVLRRKGKPAAGAKPEYAEHTLKAKLEARPQP
jgi:S1-C subfamily serine protease